MTGKETRIGLLLGATCNLLPVMVDWVVEELNEYLPGAPDGNGLPCLQAR
jgi:hypothetical protein